MTKKIGTFYGIGVGPGDPELITLKAKRVIEGAGVLAVPRSRDTASDGRSKALSILSGVVDVEGKETIELLFPMTRDAAALAGSRKEAAALLSDRLSAGVDAAFITLGDPMTYSTFSYLVPFVEAALPGVRVRSIPGVTSFAALASRAVMPLAESDERVVIIPAADDMEEVRGALDAFDTVVLMKVNRGLDRLVGLLTEMDLLANAVLASRVGWPEEEITSDVASLVGRKLDYFSTLVVRKAPPRTGALNG
ncbi:MAG: precorrin-2 C(20)-methyltransferase [Thermodesulfobacteriota bacterium]